MAARSRHKESSWDLGEVLQILDDRIYNTCEVSTGDLEQYMESIGYYLSNFKFELSYVQEAKNFNLSDTRIKRLTKLAGEIEKTFGTVRANIIRAWIVTAEYGKHRKKDAFGQGISLIANYLKAANVTKPYYWSVLLLAHAGAPLNVLGVESEDVSEIPQKFPMSGNQPFLPPPAVKVDAKIYQRVYRWSRSDHGKSCLAVFGEPTPSKLRRKT